MRKVLILSDSTCDLGKDLLEKLDVKIVPLHICFGEKSYRDLIDMKLPDLYLKAKELEMLPKTQACAPQSFIDFLTPYVKDGYEIFYTGISSKLSSTYQNFMLAARSFEGAEIYASDSLNLSTGIGLLLVKACEYRDQGLSAKQIKEKIDNLIPHVKSQFVIKTLDYLYKGGRCSALSAFFGTLLRIRPMIIVRDGAMTVGKKTIGLMKKAVGFMTETFIKDLPNIDQSTIFITNTTESDQSYNEIMDTLNHHNVLSLVKNIYHTEAGCVIGSHCGPGTIGILYIMKGDLNDETLD